MPKQNELTRPVEPVHAELILSPAMQSQTLVDRASVEEMVARQVAEMFITGNPEVIRARRSVSYRQTCQPRKAGWGVCERRGSIGRE
jgi:hypothetical protein